MSEKLKPCPFCSNTRIITTSNSVECNNTSCNAMIVSDDDSLDTAMEAWNRRTK